jgi:hypothetical protein
VDDFIVNGGRVPQLIKIDVEGGEHEVLRGGERLFSLQTPLFVAEIQHREARDRIMAWLLEHQYCSPLDRFHGEIPVLSLGLAQIIYGPAWRLEERSARLIYG